MVERVCTCKLKYVLACSLKGEKSILIVMQSDSTHYFIISITPIPQLYLIVTSISLLCNQSCNLPLFTCMFHPHGCQLPCYELFVHHTFPGKQNIAAFFEPDWKVQAFYIIVVSVYFESYSITVAKALCIIRPCYIPWNIKAGWQRCFWALCGSTAGDKPTFCLGTISAWFVD